jgi:hypothetical protein
LNVCVGNVNGIKSGRIIVKYPEKILIVPQKVLLCLRKPRSNWRRGEGEVRDRTEETTLGWRRLVADWRRAVGVVNAEKGRG